MWKEIYNTFFSPIFSEVDMSDSMCYALRPISQLQKGNGRLQDVLSYFVERFSEMLSMQILEKFARDVQRRIIKFEEACRKLSDMCLQKYAAI